MKLFDGINENTYQTMFGLMQIVKDEEHQKWHYIQHDTPRIHALTIQKLAVIDLQWFNTFDEAYDNLKSLSDGAVRSIEKYLEEIKEG